MNPFITYSYHSPEYFCDRVSESKRLLSSIRNNRNVTLFSIRRLGKTGLLKHVIHKLKNEKKTSGIYVDLYPAKNLDDFVRQFANAVLSSLYSSPQKAMLQIKSIFRGFIPAIAFDKITGEPSFELKFNSQSETEFTLQGLFSYLKKRSEKEKIMIAFDEFQQITKFPSKNTEALLRSEIQHFKNVVFIFSGSNRGILTAMFNKYSRPFYMSSEMFELKRIEKNAYTSFITSLFSKNKINISDESAGYIYDWADGITYYVQHICNRLYGANIRKIDRSDIDGIISNILNENETAFLSYRNFMTSQQWDLLNAIAKEKGINKPTGKDFISKYSLGPPSTVKSSLNALIKKELVYFEGDSFFLSDIFFTRWLERI